MISPVDAHCASCKRIKPRPICFKVDVSLLEMSLGHEKFKCERCGQEWKLIPTDNGVVIHKYPTIKG